MKGLQGRTAIVSGGATIIGQAVVEPAASHIAGTLAVDAVAALGQAVVEPSGTGLGVTAVAALGQAVVATITTSGAGTVSLLITPALGQGLAQSLGYRFQCRFHRTALRQIQFHRGGAQGVIIPAGDDYPDMHRQTLSQKARKKPCLAETLRPKPRSMRTPDRGAAPRARLGRGTRRSPQAARTSDSRSRKGF